MSKRFNPPPNWPPAPDGWTPPAGWRPDPAWGPAPAGWNFWVEDIDVDATLLPSASSPADSSDSPYAPDSSYASDDTRFPDDSNSSMSSPSRGGSLSAGDSGDFGRSTNSADETISRLPRRASRRRNGSGAHAAPPEPPSSQQRTPDHSGQANAAPGPAFKAGAAPESSRPRFASAGSAGGGQPFVPGGRNVPAGGQAPQTAVPPRVPSRRRRPTRRQARNIPLPRLAHGNSNLAARSRRLLRDKWALTPSSLRGNPPSARGGLRSIRDRQAPGSQSPVAVSRSHVRLSRRLA